MTRRRRVHPVGECPGCGLTVACHGTAAYPYLREHTDRPGHRCPKSGLPPRDSRTWPPDQPNPFRGDTLA